MRSMSYDYFGVFCSGKFIPFWNAPAPSGPTAGVPRTELYGPALILDCPGCQKLHVFQPNELKLCAPVPAQLPLHPFEEPEEQRLIELEILTDHLYDVLNQGVLEVDVLEWLARNR